MSLIIKTGILILNILYSFIKLFPQKKKITIISRQSNEPSLDITMLADKINELHHDHEVVTSAGLLTVVYQKKQVSSSYDFTDVSYVHFRSCYSGFLLYCSQHTQT